MPRETYEQAITRGDKVLPTAQIQELKDERPQYDKSLEATAIREVKEETGIVIQPNELKKIDDFMANSKAGTEESPYQQQVNIYLIDKRSEGKLPTITQEEDLKKLQWVKLSAIQSTSEGCTALGVPFKKNPLDPKRNHDDMIAKAIAKMRADEYAAKGVTLEMVKRLAGHKPESEFSPEAETWHQHALKIADNMRSLLDQYVNIQASPGQGQRL